ncbi:MAG: Arc family DNA-binding protein [Ktedonobacteraceae bacterium]
MSNEEKRFSVRFPLDLLETIKQLAKEDKRSINAEILWIVREYIQRRGRKGHAQSV